MGGEEGTVCLAVAEDIDLVESLDCWEEGLVARLDISGPLKYRFLGVSG